MILSLIKVLSFIPNLLESLDHCIFPVRTSSLSTMVYLQHSKEKNSKPLTEFQIPLKVFQIPLKILISRRLENLTKADASTHRKQLLVSSFATP